MYRETFDMDLLLIDDEASLRRTLRTTLESMGHRVEESATSEQALQRLRTARFDLAFLDLRLGREKGLDLLPMLLREAPQMGVVVVTAYASIDSAVEAMRAGAFDYLPKPFTPDQLRVVLGRWAQVSGLRHQVAELREEMRAAAPEAELETQEPAMRGVLDLALEVANSEATVLLRGESGTGKGVFARAIHEHSPRAAGPFVTVHCPSLSADLLESELFGHAKGAFTGAVRETQGKIAGASGGTLFLDEVGEVPLSVQPKLLRVLQDKTYERVGDTETRAADIRLIVATNRDLAAEVAAGKFREDLYYRINVIEIELPPLRRRPKDVLPLARHLLQFFTRQTGKKITGFTPAAEAALSQHTWPGNVRELRNAIERGVILSKGPEIDLPHLPVQVCSPAVARIELGGAVSLKDIEKEHIRRVLASTASLNEAAEVLRIDPSTLYRKRKDYGL
jgi:NtrC-family two-component system response regulator AlgB